MALGTKTDFPVLATSPTIPSPLSKISEARIFSKKLARVLEDLLDGDFSFLCGGKRPSVTMLSRRPFSFFS